MLESKSGLFDSGIEDEDVDMKIEDELREKADGLDILESLMEGLNTQLSNLEKEEDTIFKTALQHAITKTKDRLSEQMKDKQLIKEPSQSEDVGELEEKPASSKQQEKPHTKDDLLDQKGTYQEQEQPSDSSTASKKAETTEEDDENPPTLDGLIQTLMDKNRAQMLKRLETKVTDNGDDELDKDELDKDELDEDDLDEDEVKVVEEEEEEEGLDEASLAQMGEELTEELQRELSDAGLGDMGRYLPVLIHNTYFSLNIMFLSCTCKNTADVQVKLFTVTPNMLEDLLDEVGEDDELDEEREVEEEEKEDEEEGEEGEVDAYGNSKQSESPLYEDLPAGSSAASSSSSSSSLKKQLQKKKGKGDSEIKVITVKLDSLFGLSDSSDDEGGEASKGAKGSSASIFSTILNHFMVRSILRHCLYTN